MMSSSTNSTSETNSSDYITREGEEEFIRKITDSLFSDRAQGQEDNPRPFLFFINGVAGIGKQRLVTKIDENIQKQYAAKYEKTNKHKAGEEQKFSISISFSFDQINTLENLLELMEDLDKNIKHKLRPHVENPLKKDKVPEEFSKALDMYRQLKEELATTPMKKGGVVSGQQQDYTLELSKIGGMLAKGAFLAVTSGNPVSTAIPIAAEVGKKVAASAKKEVAAEGGKEPLGEELAETVGGTLGKGVSEIVNTLKNDFLNRHKATMGKEEFQKLLISPLEVLTPKLISSLVYSSRNKPLILIFENYETLRTYETNKNIDHENSILHTWFYYLLESLNKEIINQDKQANFCLIISSREKLTGKKNWKYWKENYRDRFEEYSIPYFDNSQTEKYLKSKFDSNKIDNELTTEEAKKNYRKVTWGHPGYLESICREIINRENLDYSQINQEISDKFLSSLSPKQKRIIQLVSCFKCLDPKLAESCNKSFQAMFPKEENFPEPDPNFDWFKWLIQRNFVKLTNDKYRFEDLPRNLFRRSLFQDDRELFYRGHQRLAGHFKEKADNYLPDKPNFTKYTDSEWCEYIGKFLYHACFAQIPGFETQFIYHLFASSYLNQWDVLRHSFWAINEESNLQEHPFLYDTTKKFLETLKFIATYSWVAFELDSETDYGKYKAQIAATVLLCKSQWEQLDKRRGVGKVAALEFMLKNLPLNSSKKDREKFEQSLLEEIEHTASDIDPDFSNKLFMQSTFCQTGNSDNIRDLCDKAIKYKPNNANAWYKRGLIFQRQAEAMLHQNKKDKRGIGKLYNALDSYDNALKIQRYDHRFWQSRADVLVSLGEHFLSFDEQILDLADSETSNCQERNDCQNSAVSQMCKCQKESDCQNKSGSILQQAAFYRRAYDSCVVALKFRPRDTRIEKLKDKSNNNSLSILGQCNYAFNISVREDHNGEQQSNQTEKDNANNLELNESLVDIVKYENLFIILDRLDDFCLVDTLAQLNKDNKLIDILKSLNVDQLGKILSKLVNQPNDSHFNKKNLNKQKYSLLVKILSEVVNKSSDDKLASIDSLLASLLDKQADQPDDGLLVRILDKLVAQHNEVEQPEDSLLVRILDKLAAQHNEVEQPNNSWLVKILKQLVNEPDDSLLVRILDHSNKLDDSQWIKILDQLVDQDQLNYVQLINVGDNLRLNYKNNHRALDFYYQAISKMPGDPLGWYCHGLAQTELGKLVNLGEYLDQLEKSQEHLSKLDKSQEYSLKCDEYLNKLDEAKEYFQKAINDYKKSLELKDDLDWAFYDQGIACYWIGRIKAQEAKANVEDKETKEKANEAKVKVKNKKAKEEYRKALNNEAEKRYQKALNNFDKAIIINSEYDDAWFYRGLVLDCLKHHEQAIASYDKAIQIYKSKKQIEGEVKSLYNRGLSYETLGAQEEAIASYKRATELYEENENNEENKDKNDKDKDKDKDSFINSIYHWGLALNNLDKYQEAIDKFNKVIVIADKEKEEGYRYKIGAYYDMGRSYDRLENQEKAIEKYFEAVSIEKRHIDSWYYCGMALYKLGQKLQMSDKFKKTIKISEKDIDDYEETIKRYEQFIYKIESEDQWDKEHDKLRKYQEAKDKYQKVKDKYLEAKSKLQEAKDKYLEQKVVEQLEKSYQKAKDQYKKAIKESYQETIRKLYQKAIKKFLKVIEIADEHIVAQEKRKNSKADAHFALGNCRVKISLIDEEYKDEEHKILAILKKGRQDILEILNKHKILKEEEYKIVEDEEHKMLKVLENEKHKILYKKLNVSTAISHYKKALEFNTNYQKAQQQQDNLIKRNQDLSRDLDYVKELSKHSTNFVKKRTSSSKTLNFLIINFPTQSC